MSIFIDSEKQEIKYQKNSINKKLKIKKITNFIFKHLSIFFDFEIHFFIFISFFILSKDFSDKDKYFKITLIIEVIIVE